uniref:Uncharacterized protein n=1 Tax=Arundo donax TaxID=35708 RepID=A0A0A9AV18_ARUDO
MMRSAFTYFTILHHLSYSFNFLQGQHVTSPFNMC